MSFNPEAREVVGEVAAARADFQEAAAVKKTRKSAYEDRLSSGRQSLLDIYADDSGAIEPSDVPELIRASIELEGQMESHRAAEVAERLSELQQEPTRSGILLVAAGDSSRDRDTLVAFADPSKPTPLSIGMRQQDQYYPGNFSLRVAGGTPDFPVVSARYGRYSSAGRGVGRYEVGADGESEVISIADSIIAGGFLNYKGREAFTKRLAEAKVNRGVREGLILFDEQAIEYLDYLMAWEMDRGHGRRIEKPSDLPDDLPLSVITKGIAGVELSETEKRLVENDAFAKRVLEVVSGYSVNLAGEKAQDDSDEHAERQGSTRAPLYLHRNILKLAGLDRGEIESAAEQGVLEAGKVLTDEDYTLIMQRIESAKPRKIREVVEPALTARVDRVRDGFGEIETYTGTSVDPNGVVETVFSDRELFLRLTTNWSGYSEVTDSLSAFAAGAKSFRSK